MWPRIVEIMLGCWLLISPFIFRLGPDQAFLWWNDFAVGTVLITISLVAVMDRFPRLHYLNLAVVGYLVLISFLMGGTPPPPAPYQNFMVVALLLLILAVIPTRATLPPQSWQAYYEKRKS